MISITKIDYRVKDSPRHIVRLAVVTARIYDMRKAIKPANAKKDRFES
jgi:hypothetical protein